MYYKWCEMQPTNATTSVTKRCGNSIAKLCEKLHACVLNRTPVKTSTCMCSKALYGHLALCFSLSQGCSTICKAVARQKQGSRMGCASGQSKVLRLVKTRAMNYALGRSLAYMVGLFVRRDVSHAALGQSEMEPRSNLSRMSLDIWCISVCSYMRVD